MEGLSGESHGLATKRLDLSLCLPPQTLALQPQIPLNPSGPPSEASHERAGSEQVSPVSWPAGDCGLAHTRLIEVVGAGG